MTRTLFLSVTLNPLSCSLASDEDVSTGSERRVTSVD